MALRAFGLNCTLKAGSKPSLTQKLHRRDGAKEQPAFVGRCVRSAWRYHPYNLKYTGDTSPLSASRRPSPLRSTM